MSAIFVAFVTQICGVWQCGRDV